MPCPALAVVRRRMGFFELVAAWRRAAIFFELYGFTRPSFSPVVSSTAGYAVPSFTR